MVRRSRADYSCPSVEGQFTVTLYICMYRICLRYDQQLLGVLVATIPYATLRTLKDKHRGPS